MRIPTFASSIEPASGNQIATELYRKREMTRQLTSSGTALDQDAKPGFRAQFDSIAVEILNVKCLLPIVTRLNCSGLNALSHQGIPRGFEIVDLKRGMV